MGGAMSGTTTSPVCVDAGILVRLLTAQDDGTIRGLWGRWREEGRSLIAPRLLRYEVTNALHRLRRANMLSDELTQEALRSVLDLPVAIADDPDLHPHALGLAGRFGLPAAYDAHYLALSEREGADFWTTDRRLTNSVRRTLTWVHLVDPPTHPSR